MKYAYYAAALLIFATASTAVAKIPRLDAKCGDDITVHAEEGGPILIDGKDSKIKTIDENNSEARDHKILITLVIGADGSPALTYARKNGPSGDCEVTDQ
jgi:hypothetical protein